MLHFFYSIIYFIVRYKLRAVIHHVYKPSQHFTATVIGTDGQLYLYDDLKNVKKVQTSTDPIVYGIYSRIYTF